MTVRNGLMLLSMLLPALILPACGSGPPVTPATPTPTPTPCVQTNVFQNGGPVPSKALIIQPVTTNATGRLDLILDWTFPASPVGLYLVPTGTCNLDGFNSRTCNFLVRSESGAKPRKASAANLASGTYDVLLANFATQDESMTLQAILSSSSCPALSSAPAASQSFEGQVSGMRRGLP